MENDGIIGIYLVIPNTCTCRDAQVLCGLTQWWMGLLILVISGYLPNSFKIKKMQEIDTTNIFFPFFCCQCEPID